MLDSYGVETETRSVRSFLLLRFVRQKKLRKKGAYSGFLRHSYTLTKCYSYNHNYQAVNG